MTTADIPRDHRAHPLSELLTRLSRLDVLLRQEGFAHGPDRWLNLQDLLLRMAQDGRLPDDPAALRPFIAPLFCRTPDEQRRFDGLFQLWVAGETSKQLLPEKPSVPRIPKQAAKSYRDSFRFLVMAALVTILGVGVLTYFLVPEEALEPEPEPVEKQEIPVQEKRPADGKNPALALPLQAIPPRQPLEPEQLNADYARWLGAIKVSLIAAPGVLVLAVLLWRWWRRQIVLRRHRATGDDPFSTVRLDIRDTDLFDSPAVRASLRRLHTPVARPTRHLHESATVAATIQRAGLFQPMYRDRLEVPEFVVLVQMRHRSDPVAGLAEALIGRLREADLQVTLFYYQADPRRLFNHALGLRATLSDIAGRHRDARLLIVGDPQGFVDILHGDLYAWTDIFELWPDRGLLHTEDRGVSHDRLQESGFLLFPMSSDGIVTLGNCLTAATPGPLPAAPQQPPEQLGDANAWSQSRPPPGFEESQLYQVLQAYLGGPGLLLLSAMAAYPHLHWGLTRILDLSFMPGSASERPHEARMLKLASLPWSRCGWMPDWLRWLLLNRLSNPQRQRIRRLYADLFEKLQDQDPSGIAVPLAAKPKGRVFWAYLGDIFSRAPENSAVRDRIFANLLLGGRLNLLDFELPRTVNALLPGMRWLSALMPALALLLLGSGGCWLTWWGWHNGAERWVQQPLLVRQRAQHGVLEVRILVTPGTEDLANRLLNTLKEHGFEQTETRALQPSEQETPEATNNVRHGTDVEPVFARYLARRLAHLTYQQTSELVENTLPDANLPANRIRVTLIQPPQAGGAFQDALNRTLSGEEWKQIMQALPSFIEPEMVEVPAGEFRMGDIQGDGAPDELPVRYIRIAEPFAIGKYEVTFNEYVRFAVATGRRLPSDGGWDRGYRPVINVSWVDAVDYAEWLSAQTGKKFRLPTEAEWEYAARAGTEGRFWWCADTEPKCEVGTQRANCEGCGSEWKNQTALVGSFDANPFGLHDTAGNVWEWVQDCWHNSYEVEGRPDNGKAWEPAKPADCDLRVVRGGSWFSKPLYLRSSNRDSQLSGRQENTFGFRLAMDL